MPTYIGFSTINQNMTANLPPTSALAAGKKFRVVDEQCVIQDMLNALHIRQGQKPGMPSYGTTLWDFMFEPNTVDLHVKIAEEVARVIKLDNRIILNTVDVYAGENIVNVAVELAIAPFNKSTQLNMIFDQLTYTVSLKP